MGVDLGSQLESLECTIVCWKIGLVLERCDRYDRLERGSCRDYWGRYIEENSHFIFVNNGYVDISINK